MASDTAIVVMNLVKSGRTLDLEIPLDISASELCSALFSRYFPERYGDMSRYCLRTERPIALLRGDRTLREYGLRDGSVINLEG